MQRDGEAFSIFQGQYVNRTAFYLPVEVIGLLLNHGHPYVQYHRMEPFAGYIVYILQSRSENFWNIEEEINKQTKNEKPKISIAL